MVMISLVNAEHALLVTDQVVFGADELSSLSAVIEHAGSLSALHERQQQQLDDAEAAAAVRGHEQGDDAGPAASAAQLSQTLIECEERLQSARAALREQCVESALTIVDRIASKLGDAKMLAALAVDAAEELMPDDRIAVAVHPTRVAAVDAELIALVGRNDPADLRFVVEADHDLDTAACVLRSERGSVLADLDTQLNSIRRQLRLHGGDGA